MPANPRLNLAHDFLEHTGQHIFLTGRAGTGKTTFLRDLRESSPKRMIVVAPTGVAAINAGGVTIHSFFQLPFGIWLPGIKRQQTEIRRFSKQKIAIIKSLNLLVIDEISMVRADLLDSIDEVLRRYRNPRKPFGGVQLLMIGDVQQLSPVVKDDEWAILRNHYASPYFFDSIALKSTTYACIELQHIYRQSDASFIGMLAEVRDGRVGRETISALNARYRPDFEPPQSEGYITLCTHNSTARSINDRKLDMIPEPEYEFYADVEGEFPEYSFPVDGVLRLKSGAQVMFCKNDLQAERRYVNGTIGNITGIGEDYIEVTTADGEAVEVEKAQWESIKYTTDSATGEIIENIEGVYTQYPLRTAWAITIHKSQGLTFDRAIIDAAASFSHGQVYVALSRCRTLEGLVLRTPLSQSAIFSDATVDAFSRHAEELHPTEETLDGLKQNYYQELLEELFDFKALQAEFASSSRFVNENLWRLYPKLAERWTEEVKVLREQVADVGTKFLVQLRQLMGPGYATDAVLRERTIKGCAYFIEKCSPLSALLAETARCTIDNKEIKKSLKEHLERAGKELRVKLQTLVAAGDGFCVAAYLKAKGEAIASAEISPAALKTKPATGKTTDNTPPDLSEDILNPELFELLRQWRNALAAKQNIKPYAIATQKAIIGISNRLPATPGHLIEVKGVGKVFVGKYGDAVLSIVRDFMSGREG